MPDGQQLNKSLFSNSGPYCYLDREEALLFVNVLVTAREESKVMQTTLCLLLSILK